MENLKCSGCSKFLIPPVQICEEGDIICADCSSKLQECPICKTSFMKIPMKQLNGFLKDHKRECRGRINGCQEELSSEDLDNHEAKCSYLKETKCYNPNCGQKVLSCQYLAHFTNNTFHQYQYNFRNVHLNFDVAQWKDVRHSVLVKDANNGTYEVNLKSCDKKLQIAVRFIGQQLLIQYFDLTITAICGKNELKCVSHPLAFDVSEDELWQNPNFVLLKEQCAANFKSGMISIEAYKNAPFQFQNFPTTNFSTNVFGQQSNVNTGFAPPKMFSQAPSFNRTAVFGSAAAPAPQSFSFGAPPQSAQASSFGFGGSPQAEAGGLLGEVSTGAVDHTQGDDNGDQSNKGYNIFT